MAETYDVAVVGGGATGFAAALASARAGRRTVLFAPVARIPEGRTAALLKPSVALLERLGAWERLAGEAAALRAIRLIDATRRLLRAPEVVFRASEVGEPAFGYNIANAALVEALRAITQATPDLTLSGAAVSAIEGAAESVTLRTADEMNVAARLVVGADGASSLVREAAGIAVRRSAYDQAALVTLLETERGHDDTSTEFHTEAGPFTMVPFGRNRVSLVWVGRPDRLEALASADEAAFAAAAEARSGRLLGRLRLAAGRAVFPLAFQTAARPAAARAILVGEAAHLMPPIGAQGLNLGFRDVAALERMLCRHRDDPGGERALADYAGDRDPDIRSRMLAVDALNRSLLTDFLPVQAARSVGLALARRSAPLRRMLMRQGMGV